MRHSLTTASLIVLMLTCTPNAWGQCRAEETAEIAASTRTDFDDFGACVSAAGDVAVIGAPGDDHAAASRSTEPRPSSARRWTTAPGPM